MPHDNNGTPCINLITKTRTQNQGNQALSIAWRDYLSSRYPNACIRLFERAPKYLKRYTLSALADEPDPIAALDRIARTLLAKASGEGCPDPSVWDVQHDPQQKQVVRFRRLRQVLRIRSRIAALNLGAGSYFNRLHHLTQASLAVVNPAGEFQRNAKDTALHYLLEARCAQLAGCRAAFVNLSFEVDDPTIIRLSNHVFRDCDIIEFRDEESREHFKRQGGHLDVTVLPDAAVLSSIDRCAKRGGHGIALAINALQVDEYGLAEQWDQLLPELLQLGPVTLASNEWSTDYPFWKRYLRHENVGCEGEFLGFAEYARFLSRFDVVVSSRLHTCVLGLVAGAVVVPVETGTFKLTGFFNRIGMPNEPIRMGDEDWKRRLVDRIQHFQREREERLAVQDAHVKEAQSTLRTGLDHLFTPSLLEANEPASPGAKTSEVVAR